MEYIDYYSSPIALIELRASDKGLTRLAFVKSKEEAIISNKHIEDAKAFLGQYFNGEIPERDPILDVKGPPFQEEVWTILKTIKYGEVRTYGDIAKEIASKRNLKKMSAQAVGAALNKNPIAIIIPCHRVIGVNGNLIGYAFGLETKRKLLELEAQCKHR